MSPNLSETLTIIMFHHMKYNTRDPSFYVVSWMYVPCYIGNWKDIKEMIQNVYTGIPHNFAGVGTTPDSARNLGYRISVLWLG